MSTEYEERVTKSTSIYRKLGQGLKIWHEDRYPEVDIVAVPGLGTNPHECWTWEASGKEAGKRAKASSTSAKANQSDQPQDAAEPKRQFNWLRDPDGLASLFPKSRIMLYDYASAWKGPRKVRASMKSICTVLLDDLREKRKGGTEITRPLIMIGHSMGGIVIAKTLCIARNRKEYDAMVTCTVGCVFFGSPFRGSNLANLALLTSSVFGADAYEALLEFMRTEKNDTLDEVTNDFMEISNKLAPPIELFCAWEQVPTDVSYSERFAQKLPSLLQHKAFKASARAVLDLGVKAGTHFVEKESAVLQGAHEVGLTADHRDLVKFESITSEKFIPVKAALTSMFRTAKVNVRKRTFLSGQNLLTQKTVNQVRHSLEGVDMGLKFRTREKQRPISSWLTSEPLYQEWLTSGGVTDQQCPYLWLRGGPGLGKTNASLAAIRELKASLEEPQFDTVTGQGEAFLAYFLCEWTSGCCAAEDILKSLITQIINQEESLAQHGARWFVPNPHYRGATYNDNKRLNDEMGASGAKATATVDNLWKCLQDMVDDPIVNSIHLVINNIHFLESGGSTTALLSKLRDHAISMESQSPAARRVKWLITSRNDKHIRQYLTADSISVIDLENDHEYGGKVKVARQKHAKDMVMQLRSSKNYSSDLAYYVRNSIESQSEDETWIDILCILLRAKPTNSSSLTIRKWLKEVGSYNIHQLIDHAWDTILFENEDAKLETEELMQALTISYEPPTLADLAVLAHLEDIPRLTELVRKCSPILQIPESGEQQGKVVFSNPEFGERLSIICHGPSSNPQKKRYHGLMALRCFKYIKNWYKITSAPGRFAQVAASLVRSTPANPSFDDEANLIDLDDDGDHINTASTAYSTPDCPYSIKYLFRHLSEGFPDVAQELCDDDPDFWGLASRLRNAWLKDFQLLTTDLKDVDTDGMSALHVAAGIGAKELVSILVNNNGASSLSWTNDTGMTALHIAAFNDHSDVVETLIRSGADIEAGEAEAGTALHLAALRGKRPTIALLIEKGANVNATSQKIGPVINAAICSGDGDAVKQIMDGDVRFDLDYTKCDAPLSLSARMSEPSMFQDILETGRTKWLQNVKLLDQALIAASYSGRLESVRILLKFPHVYTNNTLEKAIFSAALEKKWASVNELLDYAINDTANGNRRDVKLDDAFYLAATSRDERVDVLGKIWSFTNHGIGQDTRDFSLYQATIMRKDPTVIWLLETCEANANATAETPSSVTSNAAMAASSGDFWNPLNAAATTGNVSLVKSLLDKGAIIDGDNGYALQLAASEGHMEVVSLLLDRGASVNKQAASNEELGFFSSTALQVACENGRVGVVEALIKHGADPNLGGGALTNPITAATKRAQHDILKLLVNAPDIDVKVTGGEDQSTPLINAATQMSTEAVQLLLDNGADINALNAAGDTALIMAALRGEKACVDMLCDHGADVTYRSPKRGLAIQVAAEGLHPHCAHTLAERMGGTIDDYRERGLSDLVAAKQRLKDTLAELKQRDATIETLNAFLEEHKEQLELAKKDVDFHKLEQARLVSMSSLQGETYESVTQQMKVMQNERAEVIKQLDASRGQVKLGNDTIAKLQAHIETERQTNDALRKRQGYVTLQEEREAAMGMVEQEKKVAAEQSQLAQQKTEELESEIQVLRNEMYGLRGDLEAAKSNVGIAIDELNMERHAKQELQNEVRSLQSNAREMDETLATVQAAAARNRNVSSPRPAANGAEPQDYFFDGAVTADSGTGFHSPGGNPAPPCRKPVGSPPGSPPIASPSEFGSPPTSPRNQSVKPTLNGRNISWQAESGFRTIHGQHRADGSLGGYRKDRMMKRPTSDSLYSTSVKNGSGERQSLSTQSSYSNDGGKIALPEES